MARIPLKGNISEHAQSSICMYRTNDLEGKVLLTQDYLIFRCTRTKLVKHRLEEQSSVIISSDPKQEQ